MRSEEFQQTLNDIAKGDADAKQKLIDYFCNTPTLAEESQLQAQKTEAFMFFSEQAKKENFHVYDILGVMHQMGLGGKVNLVDAVKYFKLSVEKGNFTSQYSLGLLYQNGMGVEKNYENANKLFLEAAKQGQIHAQINLASNYSQGYGVEKNLNEAIKWYQLAGEKGVKEAQFALGKIYYNLACQEENKNNPEEIAKNYAEALKWLQLSANQLHAPALILLSSMTRKGHGLPQDLPEGFRLYLSAAKQNDILGFQCLGHIYQYGFGCVQDTYQAIISYVLALELKSSSSTTIERLTYLQSKGFGDAINIARKSELVIPVYRQECTKLAAMTPKSFDDWIGKLSWQVQQKTQELSMGNILNLKMVTILKDLQLQIQELQTTVKTLQLEKAQLQNLHETKIPAENNTAPLIQKQETQQRLTNPDLDRFYVNKLSLNQNQEFQQTLHDVVKGNYVAIKKLFDYFLNKPAINEDLLLQEQKTEAFKFFSQEVKNEENFYAYAFLGLMYECGWEVEKNLMEAAKYYKVSAENGNHVGQNKLGSFYLDGLGGLEKNIETAKKLFLDAAKKGNLAANNNLGLLYEQYEVEENLNEAIKWYQVAAEQGFYYAQYNLGKIYYKLATNVIEKNQEEIAKNFATAVKWLQSSTEQGFSPAQTLLGSMHHKGQGVPQNYHEAFKLYLLAAKQNDEQAFNNLGLFYENGFSCLKDPYQAIICYVIALEINRYNLFAVKQLNAMQSHDSKLAIAIARKSDLVIPVYRQDSAKLALMTSKSFDEWLRKLSWDVEEKTKELNITNSPNIPKTPSAETKKKPIENKSPSSTTNKLPETTKKLQVDQAQLVKNSEKTKLPPKNKNLLNIVALIEERKTLHRSTDSAPIKPVEKTIKPEKEEEGQEIKVQELTLQN